MYFRVPPLHILCQVSEHPISPPHPNGHKMHDKVFLKTTPEIIPHSVIITWHLILNCFKAIKCGQCVLIYIVLGFLHVIVYQCAGQTGEYLVLANMDRTHASVLPSILIFNIIFHLIINVHFENYSWCKISVWIIYYSHRGYLTKTICADICFGRVVVWSCILFCL